MNPQFRLIFTIRPFFPRDFPAELCHKLAIDVIAWRHADHIEGLALAMRASKQCCRERAGLLPARYPHLRLLMRERQSPVFRVPGAHCRGCSAWPSRAARARGSSPQARAIGLNGFQPVGWVSRPQALLCQQATPQGVTHHFAAGCKCAASSSATACWIDWCSVTRDLPLQICPRLWGGGCRRLVRRRRMWPANPPYGLCRMAQRSL